MNVVFADTFYWLALLNPRDSAHDQAIELSLQITGTLLTTEYVLTEVADALAAPAERSKFLRLLDDLAGDASATVVPAQTDLFQRGVDLFRRRPDKDWPLTDCISFVVMADYETDLALTGDVHFKQAGLNILFSG